MSAKYHLVWTKRQRQLIEAVKKYPIVYQRKFHHIAMRNYCWKSIAEELDLPENTCRYRWTHLRNAYVRAKRQNLTFSKYQDSMLSFLDSEIHSKKKNKNKSQSFDDYIDLPISSEDSNPDTGYDDVVVTQIVSNDPTELLTLGVNKKAPVEESHGADEFKIDIVESHPMNQSPILRPQPVETNKIQQLPTEGSFRDSHNTVTNNDIKCESTLTPNAEVQIGLLCKDTDIFVKKLSSYIINCPLEKQEDIKLKICSLFTSEELQEIINQTQAK